VGFTDCNNFLPRKKGGSLERGGDYLNRGSIEDLVYLAFEEICLFISNMFYLTIKTSEIFLMNGMYFFVPGVIRHPKKVWRCLVFSHVCNRDQGRILCK